MWIFRYKTDEHKGREAKIIKKQGGGQKYKRLLNMEKWRTNRGLLERSWEGRWAKWVRGIKESTPEIIVALCAN